MLLEQLFERFQGEGFAMTFTMEDFKRQYVKEHFAKLTPQEQQEVLQSPRRDVDRRGFRSGPCAALRGEILQRQHHLPAGRLVGDAGIPVDIGVDTPDRVAAGDMTGAVAIVARVLFRQRAAA